MASASHVLWCDVAFCVPSLWQGWRLKGLSASVGPISALTGTQGEDVQSRWWWWPNCSGHLGRCANGGMTASLGGESPARQRTTKKTSRGGRNETVLWHQQKAWKSVREKKPSDHVFSILDVLDTKCIQWIQRQTQDWSWNAAHVSSVGERSSALVFLVSLLVTCYIHTV